MPTSLATFDVSIPSWTSSFLSLSHLWNCSGRLQRYERRSNDCPYTGSTAQNIRFREPRSTQTGGTLPRAARTASGALGVTPNPSSGTRRRERCLTRRQTVSKPRFWSVRTLQTIDFVRPHFRKIDFSHSLALHLTAS